MSKGLAQLHYSDAGATPRSSELGTPKEPKPQSFVTPFMNNAYKNVEKAFNYKPGEDKRPEFEDEKYAFKGKEEEPKPRAKKRGTKSKSPQADKGKKKPKHQRTKTDATNLRKQVDEDYVPKGFGRPAREPRGQMIERSMSPGDFDQKNKDYANKLLATDNDENKHRTTT